MDIENSQQLSILHARAKSQTTPIIQHKCNPNQIHQGSINHAIIPPVANIKNSTYPKLLSSTWFIEVITICISFVCIAALVVILMHFQNRLLSEWSFFISFNAVVAIIITAAKTTLLATITKCLSQEKWIHFNNKAHPLQDLDTIDKASRGPLGSLQMLIKTSWGLASVSAIVIISSLFTDIFVQQVVHFDPGEIYIYQQDSATFGYAYGYSRGMNYNWGNSTSNNKTVLDVTAAINTDIQAAVFRGIYQTNWPSAVNCTSNCTWDQAYFTLGFSSTCDIVTEETIATAGCQDEVDSDDSELYTPSCNMTTPQGVYFDFLPTPMGPSITINSSNSISIAYRIINQTVDGYELNDSELNAKNFSKAAIWTWNPRNVSHVYDPAIKLKPLLQDSTIVECTFSIELYNYSGISFISNHFNIGTTKKIPLSKPTGNTTFQDSSCGSTCDTMDSLIWWNNTGPGVPDVFFSLADLNFFSSLLISPAFSGNLSFISPGAQRDVGEPTDIQKPGSTAAFGDGSLAFVSGVFDNIALSMTDLIRQGNAMQVAQGKTSQAVVYIRVRWLWLILPLTVHLLGGIALVGTVIGREHTVDIPLWKSSALAMLCHSVDKDGVLASQAKDVKELEKFGMIQVMLEKNRDFTEM